MLHSMTGFGKAEINLTNSVARIELRALNSKGLDVNVKSPSILRAYELPIRKEISKQLIRGKIDVFITLDADNKQIATRINEELIQSYFDVLRPIAIKQDNDTDRLLEIIMRMPNVLEANEQEFTEEEFVLLQNAIIQACNWLSAYRKKEGEATQEVIANCINTIEKHLESIPAYEKERVETVRQRILSAIENLGMSADENRLEQELIFYIEKYDISEEKTRLAMHIKHFRGLMSEDTIAKGKKLAFLSQEIGREINTIGSKANHVNIQQHVVEMKDQLEQIKEQLANTL